MTNNKQSKIEVDCVVECVKQIGSNVLTSSLMYDDKWHLYL